MPGPGPTRITKIALPFRAEGRLTAMSGEPEIYAPLDGDGLPSQVGGQRNGTTLYYSPYRGNHITLYKAGKWHDVIFNELSITNSTLGDSLAIGVGPYDVFIYLDNSGDAQIEFGDAYGQFMRPANRIGNQDGIPVKFGDSTRRLVGTIATCSEGRHTAPFKFWSGGNVNLISNLYNAVPKHGIGIEGYKSNPGGLSSFDLTASANGNWQVPEFLVGVVNTYAYAGHLDFSGDAIYSNWVTCENRQVRIVMKCKMRNAGATKYGMGVVFNTGDDIYDISRILRSCQTTLDELDGVVNLDVICPAGLYGSFMAFFAEGGTKVAHVDVSDKPRTGLDDNVLTYISVLGEF